MKSGKSCGDDASRQNPEPPPLPEGRKNREGDGSRLCARHAVIVEGFDLKGVSSRHQLRERDGALVCGRTPLWREVKQAILITRGFLILEADTGEINCAGIPVIRKLDRKSVV